MIATLGWLLLTAPRNALGRGLEIGLWTLALAACAISAATLWTLGSAQGGVPAAAALLALAAARRRASPA